MTFNLINLEQSTTLHVRVRIGSVNNFSVSSALPHFVMQVLRSQIFAAKLLRSERSCGVLWIPQKYYIRIDIKWCQKKQFLTTSNLPNRPIRGVSIFDFINSKNSKYVRYVQTNFYRGSIISDLLRLFLNVKCNGTFYLYCSSEQCLIC